MHFPELSVMTVALRDLNTRRIQSVCVCVWHWPPYVRIWETLRQCAGVHVRVRTVDTGTMTRLFFALAKLFWSRIMIWAQQQPAGAFLCSRLFQTISKIRTENFKFKMRVWSCFQSTEATEKDFCRTGFWQKVNCSCWQKSYIASIEKALSVRMYLLENIKHHPEPAQPGGGVDYRCHGYLAKICLYLYVSSFLFFGFSWILFM